VLSCRRKRNQRSAKAIALKQFKFKLQAVLDFRSEQVDRIQLQVAEEEKKRGEILARIEESEVAIQHSLAEQQQVLSASKLDPSQAQVFSGYLRRLRLKVFQEQRALALQEQRIREVRETLKQALIKKKALELLKEKEWTRFKKTVEKAEEAFLSELALNRTFYQLKG
jgi:flagellar export protein FliJ